MGFKNATIINNIMHLDSHKIFEAYVLAKRLEDKQLNEGVMDFLKGVVGMESEDKMRFNTYKDMWTRFWYPRFANKNEIKTNKDKAIDTFEKFLNSRNWADENMQAYKDAALKYFSNNHSKMDYKQVEKGALETLLYGQTSIYNPIKSATDKSTPETKPEEPAKTETDKVVDQAAAEPKTMDPAEYAKLSPEEKAKFNATHARKETVAPTPSPVAAATPTETPAEPEEEPYKLKAEITRLKKLNQSWINAINKKFKRKVRKPSDLLSKK